MSKKFTDTWVNQTTLGKHFDISAVAVGKLLKEFGLRHEDGMPTEAALDGEFCIPTPLADGTPFFMWNKNKVMELLKENGQTPLDPQEFRARELAEELGDKLEKLQKEADRINEMMQDFNSRVMDESVKEPEVMARVHEILKKRKLRLPLLSLLDKQKRQKGAGSRKS